MRLRSGFVPNVFAMGVRRQVTESTTLTAHMALWATIDTEGQRKTQPLYAWVQEWYLKLEGPWGSVVGGRALDLYSRGATQNDYMYLHGYGLGFPGNVEAVPNVSATGLIGFGVMAAFYSTGIAYATPSRFPLQNTIGVYDPTPLPGGWEGTRYPRLEDELTFDMTMRGVKLHLFANGEYQLVYRGNDNRACDFVRRRVRRPRRNGQLSRGRGGPLWQRPGSLLRARARRGQRQCRRHSRCARSTAIRPLRSTCAGDSTSTRGGVSRGSSCSTRTTTIRVIPR